MSLEHCRRVGRDDRHRVTAADAAADQGRSQAIAALARLRPCLAQPTVDQRNAIRIDGCASVEKAQRTEGNVVGGRSIQSLPIGLCAHSGVSALLS